MSLMLLGMLSIAGWIALRPIKKKNLENYIQSFLCLFLGCTPILLLILWGVLKPSPWYDPRYCIPIAGMLFSSGMNSISLAAERFETEIKLQADPIIARNISFQASLLPAMNTLFAVGLVSLPGMMTGQILSGTSPLLAVRYQIMIMISLLCASGFSAALYLSFRRSSS